MPNIELIEKMLPVAPLKIAAMESCVQEFLQRSPLRLRSLYEIAPLPSPFIQPLKRTLKRKKSPVPETFLLQKDIILSKKQPF